MRLTANLATTATGVSMSQGEDTIVYRIRSLERRMEKLEDFEPAVLTNEVAHLRVELRDTRESFVREVKAMHGLLNRLLFAVLGGSITLAVTAFTLFGGR